MVNVSWSLFGSSSFDIIVIPEVMFGTRRRFQKQSKVEEVRDVGGEQVASL